MKNYILILLFAFNVILLNAQEKNETYPTHISNRVEDTRFVYKQELPTIYLNQTSNVLIRVPETIQFIDLSGTNLIGDIPVENVARIKIADMKKPLIDNSNKEKNEDDNELFEIAEEYFKSTNYTHNEEIGIVTITAESFMTQYRIVYVDDEYSSNVTSNVEVQPNNMFPLEYPQYDLNRVELRDYSMAVLKQRKNKIRSGKASKIKLTVNNIFVVGDFFFIDISIKNKTNITYSIEDFRFSINDKKIYKATNNQSIEIEPFYQLYSNKEVKRNYRNVFVFRKFTFPNKKFFNIRLLEEQISGRTVELNLKYKDILSADNL